MTLLRCCLCFHLLVTIHTANADNTKPLEELFSHVFVGVGQTKDTESQYLGRHSRTLGQASRRVLSDVSLNVCDGFQDSAGSRTKPKCLCNSLEYYKYPCCNNQEDNTLCVSNYNFSSAECQEREDFHEDCYERGSGDYVQAVQSCVLGYNIADEFYTGLTVNECALKCDEYGFGCVAFEYGVDYGVSDEYIPGDCILKSSTNTINCPPHNLDLYVREASKGYGQCYTPGYVINDDDCEGTSSFFPLF